MSADFFDTNILIYLFDETDARRRATATNLITEAIRDGTGLISSQVVQEALNVLLTKLHASIEDARSALERVLFPLWDVYPTPALYERALDLAARHSYHFYDSLILAAALEARCDRLLSEDFQHGQVIDGLTIHNPFV